MDKAESALICSFVYNEVTEKNMANVISIWNISGVNLKEMLKREK